MLLFNTDNTWKGKGVLSGRFSDNIGLSDLFTALIKETKEVGQAFQGFVASNNRLIGQERYDLAEEMEDILGGYFYLYLRIIGEEGDDFTSQFSRDNNTFAVQFDGYAWRARGTLRCNRVAGSFCEWYNATLLKETSELIKKFGTSLADGVLDPAEKESIFRELNNTIADILCADKGLKSGELS